MPEFEPLVPLPYQERDIEQIVAHDGTGLMVSAVGGRKTLVAVEAALRLQKQNKPFSVLVIAPAGTLKRGWQRTIERQTGSSDGSTARVVRLDSTKKGKQYLQELYFGESGWYLCTPQWFARQTWHGFEPDMAIFDEIHIAGNYKNVTRAALHQLLAKRRLGLSGTPLRNKFENAWGIVRWIYPELMPLTFWEWRRTKCAGVWDRFASQNFKVTGELEPGTLMNSLPCYIQHLARERCCEFHPNGFLAELKEPEEVVRTVEMTPKQKQFYTAMEKNYVAWLTTPDDSGRLPVVAELPITAHGILRQCALGMPSVDPETGTLYFEEDCDSPKLDDLFEVIEELEGAPMVIYTHSRKFITPTIKRLSDAGYSTFEWSGANSQKKRDEAMEEFIAGNIDYLVCVISAIGTGTDGLQEAVHVEYWLSEDEDGTANEQARGRTDRPGQTERVLRIKCQAEGTDDEGIVSKQIENALRMNKIMRKKMKQ